MKILFGPSEVDINGMPPDPERGRVSQRDAEKIILISILEQAINAFPEIQDLVAINRLINSIRTSNDVIEISLSDIQKIAATYKLIKERPVNWVYYGDLFIQIANALSGEYANINENTRT